jgi:hypothetical protein
MIITDGIFHLVWWLGYVLEDAQIIFRFRTKKKEFVYSSKHQNYIWCPPSLLPSGHYVISIPRMKSPISEADRLSTSGAEVKNKWSQLSTVACNFMAGRLIKQREILTLYSAVVWLYKHLRSIISGSIKFACSLKVIFRKLVQWDELRLTSRLKANTALQICEVSRFHGR